MQDLYWLVTIIRRSDEEAYEEFYRKHAVGVVHTVHCNGTAHERTLHLLCIERTEKSMLFSVVTGETLRMLLSGLSREMQIDLPDRGVAMAIPLSGVGGQRTLDFFTEGQMKRETEEKAMQSNFELIVAIYQKGYTDLVMDAARSAGAGGGTAIRAKGTGGKSVETFFGVTLAEEKEIVFIVSDSEKKKDIMRAIMQQAGVGTKAHALVFSLPVADTAGFRFADTVEKE